MTERIDPRRAWEPYRPSPESPWDLAKAGHLYRRAGFGATWGDLQAALKDGPAKTIDRLLNGRGDLAAFEKETRPLADSIAKVNNGPQARAWWLYRMLYTPHPLRERMTLFWHNHFATSNAKVNNAASMLGMYDTLYQHALGKFPPMLQEVTKDPAMLVWLDTVQSTKAMPNENYARELMELFSLGVGHYSEKDIREAAKAFTGWKLEGGKPVFDAKNHDDSAKTVLGKTGPFAASDIVDICLEQPACPEFIAGKLYKFFISESAPATPEILGPLARLFKDNGYDIGATVGTVLRSNLFFAPETYRARVKSPVDYILGIVRGLEGRIGTTQLSLAMEGLGQSLFYPPSVKGWDGGTAWLNGQTLLFRQNLALALTSTEDPRFGRRTDPAEVARKHNKSGSDEELVEFFLQLFLQGDVPADSRARLVHYLGQSRSQTVPVYWTTDDVENHRVRTVCHLVLTLPEYQLS
jgi:uncharacterized protein (DUF1800 family)